MAPSQPRDVTRAHERPLRHEKTNKLGGSLRTIRKNFMLMQTDIEILDWLADYLGTSKSEALRTAIRSFAGQMKALDTDMRGRKFEQ